MERFIKGDIVIVPFPFSDLTSSKKRPALILASSSPEDVILCQITSNIYDKFGVHLNSDDFKFGSLNRPSLIRPNRIFTASQKIVLYKVGSIKSEKLIQVRNSIISMLDN